MQVLRCAGAALAALSLIWAGAAQAQSKDPIVIGMVVSLSGWFAPIDDGPVKGAELAVDDLNQKGGVLGRPLTIVKYDMKSEPTLGANGTIEVLSKGARFVLVTSDFDFGAPAATIAQQQGVISFAAAADPKFGAQAIGPQAYSSSVATPAQSAVMAEWAYRDKGWRSAYLLLDNTIEYTKSICRAFKERWTEQGGTVAGEDTFLNGDPSIATQITRIKALARTPDLIYLCSYPPGAASALRQLRNAGIDLPALSSQSMDGAYWLGTVPDLSNFYFATGGSMFGDDPSAAINAFFERYRAKFGEAPVTSYPLMGYTAIQAWAIASERAGSLEGKAVSAELDKFRDEPLIAGPATYAPDTHILLTTPLTVMQIQKGRHSAITRYVADKVPATGLK